jgi:CheY-like chemotaxis protein
MLSAVGCEVFFATDGGEALMKISGHRPGIVFLDLLLPGMSGAETARKIYNEFGGDAPKLVAHTASVLTLHREDALVASCVDFIAKPFECEQLYACLEQHLGVQFQHAEPVAEEIELAASLEPVALPEELCARLMVAAELHSTTTLKACLQELRQLGPATQRLADQIRLLMRSYDMDGIQRLLSQVALPSAAEIPSSDSPAASSRGKI